MKHKLGFVQMNPKLGDLEANLEAYLQAVEAGEKAGVDLLIFPELSLTGYFLRDMVPVVAIHQEHAVFQKLVKASKRVPMVVGLVEESPACHFYNSAVYLEGGRILHVHRKVYLPTYGMFDEQRYFKSGQSFRTFRSALGTVGMLICEDAWHLSSSYILSQEGLETLIIMSASPGRGYSPDQKGGIQETWQRISTSLAQFFLQYVAYCNRVGYEDGIGFWGGSHLADPEGNVISAAPRFEETLHLAELDMDIMRRVRMYTPLLRDERLDITLRELGRINDERTRIGL